MVETSGADTIDETSQYTDKYHGVSIVKTIPVQVMIVLRFMTITQSKYNN